jgi:transposase
MALQRSISTARRALSAAIEDVAARGSRRISMRCLSTSRCLRRIDRPVDWIQPVEQDSFAALASFLRNLGRHYLAIRNGLTLRDASGPVEGNINRIETLERQISGCANLDLRRKRILVT